MNKIHSIIISLFLCQALHCQTEVIDDVLRRNPLDTSVLDLRKPFQIHISEEEMKYMLDRQPSFGMYKNNYAITGVPTNRAINTYSADVKYQVSVYQRLTKSVLPHNFLLMLTYTQKSYWKLYRQSAPFEDNTYNPGLMLIKPVIKDNRLLGVASLALEHESNGKDSLDSRGWNYLVFSGLYNFNSAFSVQLKLWAGILDQGYPDLDGGGNPDYFKYRGYGLLGFHFKSPNDMVRLSAYINPRPDFGHFNTEAELNFKFKAKSIQYLYIQWYNGYCENMLDYNRYTSMVRAGICFKSPFRDFY